MTADKDYIVDADGKLTDGPGFLLVAEGCEISDEDAKKHGIDANSGIKPKADDK